MARRCIHTVLRGALLGVVLMLSACVNSLELATPNGRNRSQDREQAIREAVAYFDNHRALLTRSAEAEPSEEAPFVVGDVVVDWESAVTVANEEKRYTDFAMRKDNRFYLLLVQEDEQMEAVELYSRFASVEDFGLDTMNQYVATYIPDVEYLQTYRNVAHDGGINCEEWYEFSGVVMYTMLSGHYVAAYRYDGGTLTERAFLYDKEQTDEENIADFCSVMEGLTLGVAVEQEGTRSTDENNPTWIDEIVITNVDTSLTLIIIDSSDDDDEVATPIIVEPVTHNLVGGGGGGSAEEEEEDSTGEELLEDLFDTSELSDEQKKIVGEMLVEIIRDCMGGKLYNKLAEKCRDNNRIIIVFATDGSIPSYKNTTQTITIVDTYSDTLLHEMFHAYQDMMINGNLATISANLEIEAQVAKYKYAYRKDSPISKERLSSEYRDTDLRESFYSLHCTMEENSLIKQGLTDAFIFTYNSTSDLLISVSDTLNLGYKFDPDRSMTDNFSNIIELSSQCN